MDSEQIFSNHIKYVKLAAFNKLKNTAKIKNVASKPGLERPVYAYG